jgi:hypothetical protein
MPLGQVVNTIYSDIVSADQTSFKFDASVGSDPNGLHHIQLIVDVKIYAERVLHFNR